MNNRKFYANDNNVDEIVAAPSAVEVEEVAESMVEEIIEEPVVEEVVEESKNSHESLVGYVTGCEKLNIRKDPYIKSDIVCVVSEKDVLLVDQNKSTNEWYRVYTETGFDGYCMKRYVTVSD